MRRAVCRAAGGAAVLCAILMALAACAPADSAGPASAEEVRALIAAAKADAPDLQPGEKLRVTVFGEDRLTGDYQIDPGGDLSLPLAGSLKAAGLSKRDLEASLARRLRGAYLRDPKVTIEVTDFKPFYILGEVAKPGEYPFRGGLDVLSAVALAGGATYRASRGQIPKPRASPNIGATPAPTCSSARCFCPGRSAACCRVRSRSRVCAA